ncbi:phytanoyl-CoA dioxygenase family protein [Larkinella harenae]
MSSLRDSYKQNGFVLLKNFLDKDLVAAIHREGRQIFAYQIQRTLGESVDIDDLPSFEQAMYRFFAADFTAFANTGKQVQHMVSLHRLGTDSRITDTLKELGLDYPSIGVRPAMLFNSRHLAKRDDYWRLGAHQDWRTGQGSLDSIVVWFPLVPAGADLGALQVIPGSHRQGLYESTSVDYIGTIPDELLKDEWQQLEFEVGDVLFFSAFLVHRSGINSTESVRWSVQLRYNNLLENTFIERGYPLAYIYKPQAELITPNFPVLSQMDEIFN